MAIAPGFGRGARGYSANVDAKRLGETALVGWRGTVADAVAKRVPIRSDRARAAIGAVFFALAVRYVAQTIGRAVRQRRA